MMRQNWNAPSYPGFSCRMKKPPPPPNRRRCAAAVAARHIANASPLKILFRRRTAANTRVSLTHHNNWRIEDLVIWRISNNVRWDGACEDRPRNRNHWGVSKVTNSPILQVANWSMCHRIEQSVDAERITDAS